MEEPTLPWLLQHPTWKFLEIRRDLHERKARNVIRNPEAGTQPDKSQVTPMGLEVPLEKVLVLVTQGLQNVSIT